MAGRPWRLVLRMWLAPSPEAESEGKTILATTAADAQHVPMGVVLRTISSDSGARLARVSATTCLHYAFDVRSCV
eukprot:3881130-Alexandrium_andersonii.AAC.1